MSGGCFFSIPVVLLSLWTCTHRDKNRNKKNVVIDDNDSRKMNEPTTTKRRAIYVVDKCSHLRRSLNMLAYNSDAGQFHGHFKQKQHTDNQENIVRLGGSRTRTILNSAANANSKRNPTNDTAIQSVHAKFERTLIAMPHVI